MVLDPNTQNYAFLSNNLFYTYDSSNVEMVPISNVSVGNTTVNTQINATAFTIQNSTIGISITCPNTTANSNGYVLVANGSWAPAASVGGVNLDSTYAWTNTHTFGNTTNKTTINTTAISLTNVGIYTALSYGSNGDVLTSNGTTVYWTSASTLSINTSAQYSWSNVHTFTGGILVGNSTVNNSITNGQVSITSAGFNTYMFAGGTAGLEIDSLTDSNTWIGLDTTGYWANGDAATLGLGWNYTTDSKLYANTTSLSIGNTTSNVRVGASSIQIGNATANAYINLAATAVKFFTQNSSSRADVEAGWIGVDDPTNGNNWIGMDYTGLWGGAVGLGFGNSTVNVSINTTSIFITGNATFQGSYFRAGGASSNLVMSGSELTASNLNFFAPTIYAKTTAYPTYVWYATSGATDEKYWDILSDTGNSLQLRAVNDTYTAANTLMTFTRGTGIALSDASITVSVPQNQGNGISWGSAVANATTDLTRHLLLHTAGYGIGITSNRQNYVVASGGTHNFLINGTDVATIDADRLWLYPASSGIELGSGGAGTPYIDFHSYSSYSDYDARLIASGGTGSSGGGDLKFIGTNWVHNAPYLNFGSTGGSSGYGIRDNSGVMEVKPSGDDWRPITKKYESTLISLSGLTGYSVTGVPTWVRRITIILHYCKLSGSAAPLIQIGDSGGLENTGYLSSVQLLYGGVASYSSTSTIGFLAAYSFNTVNIPTGVIVLERTGHVDHWYVHGTHVLENATVNAGYVSGRKALSAGPLTQFYINTTNGTDTYNASAYFGYIYEG